MCRSIRVLRTPDGRAGDDDVRAAALQFVRKVSGFWQSAGKNEAAFATAVDSIAAATRKLLADLPPLQPARAARRPPSPGTEHIG